MAELTDPEVRPGAVLLAAAIVLAAVLGALGLAWLAWWRWAPPAAATAPMTIAGPLLESAPQRARAQELRRQQALRAQWRRAAAPPPAVTPRVGAQLPLQLRLRDAAGREVRLGDYFGRAPVLLVFGYYRCRRLCSLVFDDALQAALRSGAAGYQLLGVSIDPGDGPAQAAPRQAAYRRLQRPGDAPLVLLSGAAGATRALAQAAGFGFRYDPAQRQYLHPAALMVVTPSGRMARYFTGLRYAPQALRQALLAARAGAGPDRAGWAGAQVQLLCGQLAALSGHGAAAWLAVRLAALAGLALLALGCWRLRRGRAP